MTFVRFFCSIDSTPHGRIALAHLDALQEVTKMPIRLIGVGSSGNPLTEFSGRSGWNRHVGLLSTPLETSYVNVVCTEAIRWATLWTARLATAGAHGVKEAPSGCLRNVLIMAESAAAYGASPRAVSEIVDRYDAVVEVDRVAPYNRVNVASLRAALALE